MVKAAAGGGGRGIRVATRADELATLVEEAAREAEASFGDGRLYLERMLVGARHVEVQVLGDGQRRRDPRLRARVLAPAAPPEGDGGVALPRAHARDPRRRSASRRPGSRAPSSYAGAGTLEYLLDADGSFYFIEMNTRIQVEHPVTEVVTGIDLVREQLRIAAGEPLSLRQEDVVQRGHAIEFRINAEDPTRGFLPSPGTITELRLPGGPGVRVDTAIYPGYAIPPFYDSLVAKLIVWGADRARGDRPRQARPGGAPRRGHQDDDRAPPRPARRPCRARRGASTSSGSSAGSPADTAQPAGRARLRLYVQPTTSQRRVRNRAAISTSRTTTSTVSAAQTPVPPQSSASVRPSTAPVAAKATAIESARYGPVAGADEDAVEREHGAAERLHQREQPPEPVRLREHRGVGGERPRQQVDEGEEQHR